MPTGAYVKSECILCPENYLELVRKRATSCAELWAAVTELPRYVLSKVCVLGIGALTGVPGIKVLQEQHFLAACYCLSPFSVIWQTWSYLLCGKKILETPGV